MRGLVLRVVALAAIVGQLQLLPASIACAAQHRRPASHCGQTMPVSGPAVGAAHDAHASPLCSLGTGCMASSVAVTAAAGFTAPAAALFAVPARATLAPPSFASSPAPPPPNA